MRHHRSLLVALVVLSAAACATASLYTLKLKPYQLEGITFPLPSGMQVFFQEDHGQPSVLVASVYDVGSTAEPPGKDGMAHLMEHLWFRAKSDQDMAVMDRIKTLGGIFNAMTGHDSTTFFTVGPKDSLEALLKLEGIRLTAPLGGVTEEVVTTEREVVRNELRLGGETNADSRIFDTLFTVLFPAPHPYNRSVIGTHESLDSVKLADVQAYVNAYYKPANVTLVIAGDFDKNEVRNYLARTLPQSVVGDPKGPMQKPQRRYSAETAQPPPEPSSTAFQHMTGPVKRTRVFLAWSLPAAHGESDVLMQAAVQSMIPAITDLLVPEGIYDKAKIGEFGCEVDPEAVNSAAFCYFEVMPGNDAEALAKKALDGLWEMWDLNTRDWRKEDLSRGKTGAMAGVFAESGSLWRGMSIADSLHYTGAPDYFSRTLVQLAHVEEGPVRRFAYKYLNRNRAVTLIVEPEDAHAAGRPVTTERGSDHSASAFGEKKSLDAMFATLKNEAIEKTAIAPDLTEAKELTLENGLHVIMKRHGASPFVTLELFTRGGRYDSTPGDLASYAFDLHDARDPLQVAGMWRVDDLIDGRGIAVSVPSGNLAAGIDLLATRAETTTSGYERVFYDATMREAEPAQEAQTHDPIWVLAKEQRAKLFPGHPLGKVDDDFAALKTVGKKEYADWFARTVAPKNASLLIVGDVSLDEGERLVRERFSKWRATDPGARLPALPPPPPAPARQVLLLDRPHTVQTTIDIACPIAKPVPEALAARRVATELLTENIWRVVRERLGATYGVYAVPERFRSDVDVVHVEGSIQSDKVAVSLKVILDAIKTYADGHADTALLQETKWGIARHTHTDTLTTDQMLATFIGLESRDASLGTLATFPHELAEVDAAALARELAPCPGHEVIGIIGPAEALRPALAGLGTIVDVPWTSTESDTAKPDAKAGAAKK